MDDEKTHYQVLGLKPGARHTEIGIAYQRIMGKRRAETAPPDPKLDARIQEAYDVLSDIEQREYYDAELRARMLRAPSRKGRVAAIALVIAGFGIATWWWQWPAPGAVSADEARESIVRAAAPALGALEALQVSGAAATARMAISVEEGVMLTSCQGLAPGTQLVVAILGRKVPASVRSFDEASGLCQLSAPNTGSWPLSVSREAAKAGDVVYAARLTPQGEVVVEEGTVKRVMDTPRGRVIETTLPARPDGAGSPLFDSEARLAAIMAPDAEGDSLHLVPPAELMGVADAPAASKPAHAAETAAPDAGTAGDRARASGEPADAGTESRNPLLSADPKGVRRKLEKAYSKPSVPDDL